MRDAARILDGSARREQEAEAVDQPEQAPAIPIGTQVSEAPPLLHISTQLQYTVSSAFHAELLVGDEKPDIVLVSSDHVLFYAHKSHILASSNNTFNGRLNVDAIGMVMGSPMGSLWVVGVSTDSVLFNVVLHTLYGMSCSQFNPPLEALLHAVTSLKTYGISLDHVLSRNTPLYNLIVAETPRRPIDVFLVAAENDLDELAVTTSAHLLSLKMSDITDEMADRMGPRYLKRLALLHLDRMDYLKQLIMDIPQPHEDTPECGFIEQTKLARAWALAAASLVWDIRPGKSSTRDIEFEIEKESIVRSAFGRPALDIGLVGPAAGLQHMQTVPERTGSPGRSGLDYKCKGTYPISQSAASKDRMKLTEAFS
ncbi:hypothetical protein EIP91_010079 [Steccherinum ochraceum]|uniref:Uncharacterized protein n=1 Tax=Steccherinum ochraceum TaxID=92696 RepID=A0A4V2MUZ1_9APHY|nr:hypothetical protein EIP91_010079 [Steccherinum ochraceum]